MQRNETIRDLVFMLRNDFEQIERADSNLLQFRNCKPEVSISTKLMRCWQSEPIKQSVIDTAMQWCCLLLLDKELHK